MVTNIPHWGAFDSGNVGSGGIWEITVPYSQFCYAPKTALKNKFYLN